jgi:hypothetical protein
LIIKIGNLLSCSAEWYSEVPFGGKNVSYMCLETPLTHIIQAVTKHPKVGKRLLARSGDERGLRMKCHIYRLTSFTGIVNLMDVRS